MTAPQRSAGFPIPLALRFLIPFLCLAYGAWIVAQGWEIGHADVYSTARSGWGVHGWALMMLLFSVPPLNPLPERTPRLLRALVALAGTAVVLIPLAGIPAMLILRPHGHVVLTAVLAFLGAWGGLFLLLGGTRLLGFLRLP